MLGFLTSLCRDISLTRNFALPESLSKFSSDELLWGGNFAVSKFRDVEIPFQLCEIRRDFARGVRKLARTFGDISMNFLENKVMFSLLLVSSVSSRPCPRLHSSSTMKRTSLSEEYPAWYRPARSLLGK